MTDTTHDLNLPIVRLPGFGTWKASHYTGLALEERFPGQCAYHFTMACAYNDNGPLTDGISITAFLMAQEGERDEGSWVWIVALDNHETWCMAGWCDYTGWDCQSGTEWVQVPA